MTVGGGRTGLRARLGGGECEVAFWKTPSPVYIEPTWAAEKPLLQIFVIPSEFGSASLSVFQKILKLNIITNKNYYKVIYYIYWN